MSSQVAMRVDDILAFQLPLGVLSFQDNRENRSSLKVYIRWGPYIPQNIMVQKTNNLLTTTEKLLQVWSKFKK